MLRPDPDRLAQGYMGGPPFGQGPGASRDHDPIGRDRFTVVHGGRDIPGQDPPGLEPIAARPAIAPSIATEPQHDRDQLRLPGYAQLGADVPQMRTRRLVTDAEIGRDRGQRP